MRSASVADLIDRSHKASLPSSCSPKNVQPRSTCSARCCSKNGSGVQSPTGFVRVLESQRRCSQSCSTGHRTRLPDRPLPASPLIDLAQVGKPVRRKDPGCVALIGIQGSWCRLGGPSRAAAMEKRASWCSRHCPYASKFTRTCNLPPKAVVSAASWGLFSDLVWELSVCIRLMHWSDLRVRGG